MNYMKMLKVISLFILLFSIFDFAHGSDLDDIFDILYDIEHSPPADDWKANLEKLVKETEDEIERARLQWNTLVQERSIMAVSHNISENDYYLGYNITADLKLKDILSLLQYYHSFGPGYSRDVFFEINIGGFDSKFRLKSNDQKQLHVLSMSDSPLILSDVLNKFNGQNDSDIARILLISLESNINNQPTFEESAENLVNFLLVTTIIRIPETQLSHDIKKAINYMETGQFQRGISVIKKLNNNYFNYSMDVKDVLRNVIAGDPLTLRQAFTKSNSPTSTLSLPLLPVELNDKLSQYTALSTRQRLKNNIGFQQQSTATIQSRKTAETKYLDGLIKQTINKAIAEINGFCGGGSSRRKRSICEMDAGTDPIILKDGTTSFNNNILKFVITDKQGSRFEKPITLTLDQRQLVYSALLQYMKLKGNIEGNSTDQRTNIETLIAQVESFSALMTGVYGLEDEKTFRGFVSISDKLKLFKEVADVTHITKQLKQALHAKILSFDKDSSLRKFGEKFEFHLESENVKTLAESLTLVTDVFSIDEDIADFFYTKTNNAEFLPVKIVNLVADVSDLILDLMGPEMEPIVLAIDVLRMAFDDLYIDIFEELDKVNWNSPWAGLEAYGAIIIGELKGIGDLFTGGMIRQMSQLKEEVNQNRELLKQLSNISNYYNFSQSGNGSKAIDFNAGKFSIFAGGITFKLLDNGHADLTIVGIPKDGGGVQTLHKVIPVDGDVRDIILGLGESRSFTYTKRKAKLFWCIPVKSYNIICGENLDSTSLHGTYYGNSQNNSFMALQQIPTNQANSKPHSGDCSANYGKIDLNSNLQNYYYELYGEDGDDKFFLGPQISSVEGGEGSDIYLIEQNTGKAIINNFAKGKDIDTLFLNVSFTKLSCSRDGNDLYISHASVNRVIVKNYFQFSKYSSNKHMVFRSADGVIFYPNATSELDTIFCMPTMIEKSDSVMRVTINTMDPLFKTVLSVVGSQHGDNIIGNDNDNTIDCGGGNDYVKGGEGSDTYLVRNEYFQTFDKITINNFATDNKTDILIVEVPFRSIANTSSKSENNLLISFSSVYGNHTVELLNWMNDDSYDHISFISSDHVMFTVELQNDTLVNIPKVLDLSSDSQGACINLLDPRDATYQYSAKVSSEIVSILDTPYNDKIKANNMSNFLTCTGGTDILEGGAGKDRYVIKNKCIACSINNFDMKNETDVLILFEPYESIRLQTLDEDSLLMVGMNVSITFVSWFKDERYRHMLIQLNGGEMLVLPVNTSQLDSFNSRPMLSEMNYDPECGPDGYYKMNMKTTHTLHLLRRVQFKSSTCSYNITGNELNNYFEIGPGVNGTSQYIEGENGVDTFKIGANDGQLLLNNLADDNATDHLILGIFYRDMKVVPFSDDTTSLTIHSENKRDNLEITIFRFCYSNFYRHLQIHSTDGITFHFEGSCDDIRVIVDKIDKSNADSSQNINADISSKTETTQSIYGSLKYANYLLGNDVSNKLVGGMLNDIMYGNDGNDWIQGQEGSDVIHGGVGMDVIYGDSGDDIIYGDDEDDVLYPSDGADVVIGGSGKDTVVLQGDVASYQGVFVNLDIGYGLRADAQGDIYLSVENAIGSDFNDVLIGNNHDNVLIGYFGNDTFIPGDGDDQMIGGDGKDIYILYNNVGVKTIDNFANDSETDILYVNNAHLEDVCYFSSDSNLHLGFSTNDTTKSYSSINKPFIDLPSWFTSSMHQHLLLLVNDGSVEDLSELTSNVVNVTDMFNALENVTDMRITTGFSELTVHWSENVWKVANKCDCDLVFAYKKSVESKFALNEIHNGQIHYVVHLSQVESYEFKLILGKCGRLISMSSPVTYDGNFMVVYITIAAVLGLATVVFASVMILRKKCKRTQYQSLKGPQNENINSYGATDS